MNATEFAAALAALGVAGEPFAVAVSGGPDSLALLLLAQAANPGQVHALTVDHGLRVEAAGEAAMVAAVCTRLGVPHATLSWKGEKPAANLQAEARTARYALMGDWCAAHAVPWLLTGHHADDQAETLLMRLARGSGSAGLAAIRESRALLLGVTILRPLLGVRRDALRAVVDAAGLRSVDDPANRSPAYDRTAARALLTATPWLAPERLAATVAHLADAEAALDWTANLAWEGRARRRNEMLEVDAAGLPREFRRRLAVRALATLGVSPPGPQIDRLLVRLDAGGTTTLAGVQARGGPMWTFRRVPPRNR